MRIRLELSEEKKLRGIDFYYVRRVVEVTCRVAFPKTFGTGMVVRVEVASVADETMRVLNREYRKKNKPTDILSFGTLSSPEETRRLRKREIDLGQIVVAPDYIRHYAREDKVAWKHEFTFVLAHGVLHLMGYDHGKEMFALQDQITEKMLKLEKAKK